MGLTDKKEITLKRVGEAFQEMVISHMQKPA